MLDADDSIIRIKAGYENELSQVFEDSESTILQQFTEYVLSKDPIVFTNQVVDILPYLLQRLNRYRLM